MDKVEIKNLIEESVGTAVAKAFGIMQEWFVVQIEKIHEGQAAMQDSMDRQFAEVRADIAEMKTDIVLLKLGVHSIDGRVAKLEKHHEHDYA